MKNIIFYSITFIMFISFVSCNKQVNSYDNSKDTVYVHDTISLDYKITYNLPCKVEYINTQNNGKAILVFWLHGGVYDRNAHNFLNPANNHIDQWRNKAYNAISAYLHDTGIKAIYVAPLCHKAEKTNCVRWIECSDDLKKIIDDYVSNGLVDRTRIYIAGCSDGGVGVWDLIENHGEWFAAAMSFSCGCPRMTNVPIYYSTTKAEGDKTSIVNALKSRGSNIKEYSFHPEESHGGDEKITLNTEYLHNFFSNINNR